MVPVPIPPRLQRGQRNPKSSCPRCAQLPWGFVTRARAPAPASPHTPPIPAHHPVLGESRVSHSNPSWVWGSSWATLGEGGYRDGGSLVPSLVAQPLHWAGDSSVSCAPNS